MIRTMRPKSPARPPHIKAVPYRMGYTLKTEEGEYPEEKYVYPSRASAYQNAARLWPRNSGWHGRKVKGGYRIDIR